MKLAEYQKANPDCLYKKLAFQWRERDVYQELDARPKEGMDFSGFPFFLLVEENGEAEFVKEPNEVFGIMRAIREQKEDA